MSVSVFLGLGSNLQPAHHLKQGIEALRTVFGELIISPFYECEAVGFAGPNFLNGAVGFATNLSLEEVIQQCRSIEEKYGRDPQAKKWSSRTLDIDVLIYGDAIGEFSGVQLPRPDILNYAFVLWPLADIAADSIHPIVKKSYGMLREEFQSPHRIQVVV